MAPQTVLSRAGPLLFVAGALCFAVAGFMQFFEPPDEA